MRFAVKEKKREKKSEGEESFTLGLTRSPAGFLDNRLVFLSRDRRFSTTTRSRLRLPALLVLLISITLSKDPLSTIE